MYDVEFIYSGTGFLGIKQKIWRERTDQGNDQEREYKLYHEVGDIGERWQKVRMKAT